MKRIYKLAVIGVVIVGCMVIIGAADVIGTWKKGSSVVIDGEHYHLLKSKYTLGDEIEYKEHVREVIGIKMTRGEVFYLLVNNGEAFFVPESKLP